MHLNSFPLPPNIQFLSNRFLNSRLSSQNLIDREVMKPWKGRAALLEEGSKIKFNWSVDDIKPMTNDEIFMQMVSFPQTVGKPLQSKLASGPHKQRIVQR